MDGGKFYSTWQPIQGGLEDSQTALVFGFLRHAPVDQALRPWLAEVLGAPTLTVAPLAAAAFWPQYPSRVDGYDRTEPELVFEVDAGGPVLVVIENKISDTAHTYEQISREVIDVAASERPRRVALVMVGPDLGVPYELTAWEGSLKRLLRDHRLGSLEARLYYSPWRDVGHHIRAIGLSGGGFSSYAEDVVQQLIRSGQMGYEGAPVLDDLTMDIPGAVDAYNRIVLAARQLFRDLTKQPRFAKLGLGPWRGASYRMATDNNSRALSQPEDYFQFSTMACCMRKPKWGERQGVFAAVTISAAGPELCAGAYACLLSDVTYTFANSDETPVDDARDTYLAAKRAALLPYLTGTRDSTFKYASRPWITADGHGDVQWLLDVLTKAVAIQDDYPRTRRGTRK